MQFLIILSLALASVVAEVQEFNKGRIINGMSAANGQFGYQAAIFTNCNTFCGAFIHGKCFMTAAHCVDGVQRGRVIYATTNVYSNSSSYQNFTSSAVRIHPLWNSRQTNNDIALIIMKEALPTSALVQYVQLPCSAAACATNETIVVTGFGKTSDSSSISKTLQYVELPILSRKVCEVYFKRKLFETQMCVGAPNNSSACNGDSGGPGVLTGTTTACGVVSYGSRLSCQVEAPIVFTRIPPYYNWIKLYCN